MTLSRRTRRLAALPALALAVPRRRLVSPPRPLLQPPRPVPAQGPAARGAAAAGAERLPRPARGADGLDQPAAGLRPDGLRRRGAPRHAGAPAEAASKQENTLTDAAGDLIGATALLSAAFHDEPTIESLNRIGLDYASVGNHEFDEGADELLRIQHGGCHPEDGCADEDLPYQGADFQYLSANAFVKATGEPLLPPYAIHKVQGVEVGFIGMTLEGTPSIVSSAGIAGLEFADEAATANRYAAELRAQGVETIIVLLHEGGVQAPGSGIDDCNGLTGPITDMVPMMDDAIDVVITGHTHQAYERVLDDRLVTSASSAAVTASRSCCSGPTGETRPATTSPRWWPTWRRTARWPRRRRTASRPSCRSRLAEGPSPRGGGPVVVPPPVETGCSVPWSRRS